MTDVSIAALTIYPVKSMRGIDLEQAELGALGLRHDRQFMVVRANGKFLTQRDNGRMALIETAIESGGVRMSRPGFGAITIPFDSLDGEPVATAVWGAELEGSDLGDELGGWLTEALASRQDLRLIKLHPGCEQGDRHPKALGPGVHTLFADAAPFLVAGQASLAVLNRALEARGLDAVPMNRFRPNIVVRGLPAFAEHGEEAWRGPGYTLRLCAPCERCVITTIDQDTGVRHPDRQPFKTLAEINPMPGNPSAPAFAQYAVLAAGAGARITVGDRLSSAP